MSDTCKAETPGAIRPVVDPNKCEGSAACVAACPYEVFEVVSMSRDLYRFLSLLGKLKARVHGMKTAAMPKAEHCMNCGLCVAACPEKAIRLRRFAG